MNRLSRGILLLLLFPPSFLSPCVYSQTCIIVHGTPDLITIGSDSRGTIVPRDNKILITHIDTLCKIKTKNKIYFACSGGLTTVLYSLAFEVCQLDMSFEDKCRYFKERVENRIKDSLSIFKSENFKRYREYYPEIRESSILFFGFDSGRAKISAFVYTIASKMKKPLKLKLSTDINWPGPGLPDSCILSIGTFKRVQELLNNPFLNKMKPNPIDRITYLINAQSEASSNVGGPIDILQIDRKGIVFEDMKEGCRL
ncbi:MAG: hypothetical protein P4L51_23220 [Puia sp.]|nr:hypothetical protein [Puia sp.]